METTNAVRDYDSTLLLKPTHACNFECKYCYDAELRKEYGHTVMSMDTIRKVAELSDGKSMHLIFHGGEPLYVGIDWYYMAFEILTSYKVDWSFSLQSNGSLLNKEWVELFKKYDLNFGISYDFFKQRDKRSDSFDIKDKIKIIQDNDFHAGFICVVSEDVVRELKQNYLLAAEVVPYNLSFNLIFSTSEARKNNERVLSMNDLIYGFGDFLQYYLYRPDGMPCERTADSFIKIVFGVTPKLCTYIDCRFQFIGVSPDGVLYPCDRYFKNYKCGNLNDFNSWNDFKRQEGFKRYYKDVTHRYRADCINCSVFPVCGGGCNANHIDITGTARNTNVSICENFFALFGTMYDALRTVNIRKPNLNNKVREEIISKKFITLSDIYDFLVQYLDYMHPLQYSGIKSCMDSIEYKIFRIFNPFRVNDSMNNGNNIKDIFEKSKDEIKELLVQNTFRIKNGGR